MTAATSVTGRPAPRSARAVPPGADQLEATRDQARREVRQGRLVRHGHERAPRRDDRRRAVRINPHHAGVHREGAADQQPDGAWEEPVLDRVEPLLEGRLVVVGSHLDRLGQDDRAPVERRVHEVDRHPGHRRARSERIPDRVRTREARQEGRVDIQDPAREGRQHSRADEPHEAGKDDGVGAHRRERRGEGPIGLGSFHRLARREPGKERGLEAGFGRPVEGRARPVGEDDGDRRGERPSRDARLEGTEVRPAARDSDRDPLGHSATST